MTIDRDTFLSGVGPAIAGDYRFHDRILRELAGTNLLGVGGGPLTATIDELNELDLSVNTQAITAASAITLSARHVTLVGPTSSTYAVTLAAPDKAGRLMVIEMLSTTSTNAVTLALTNVVGGTASSSASFDAAGEILILLSASLKWVVIKQQGVTLS